MAQVVNIRSIKHLTHDVIRLTLDKPEGLVYTPGQAVDISINTPEWKDVKSCFTFTSLTDDDHIEFVIKTYPSRNRVTNQLLSTKVGDEILVYKPFGDIKYKGDGLFLAGGAGITPFIAILRKLEKENRVGNNKLIFANKKREDIIMKDYFDNLLGGNFINVLSEEDVEGFNKGYITAEIISSLIDGGVKYFYLCGPKPMMSAVEKLLASLGVGEEQIVKEGF